MPCGPTSAASCRQKPSMAAQATPKPPTLGYPMTALAVMARMTPDPFLRMWRAAAVTVREWADIAFKNRHAKKSRSLSKNRHPLAALHPTALEDPWQKVDRRRRSLAD